MKKVIPAKILVQVPKRFKLWGRTVTVRYDDMEAQEQDFAGQARYETGEIVLATGADTLKRHSQRVQSLFFHELAHWLLYSIEENKLGKNENFVGLLGSALHQAISTMEF